MQSRLLQEADRAGAADQERFKSLQASSDSL
jgi:hypothetical protein